MKLFKSLPSQVEFYEKYADLIHSLTKVSLIASIITGICELSIITALIKPTIADIFPNVANFLSIGLSFVFASLLQISLRKVFPHLVRSILNKQFKGLHLPFTIVVFLLTIGLLTASIFLSYKGSAEIGTLAVSIPQAKSTNSSDSLSSAASLSARLLYSSDSATIETKYGGKVEAINSTYTSQINAIERNGYNHATSLRAELKTKLGQLKTDKASELEEKATKRDESISRSALRNEREVSTIGSDSKAEIEKAKLKQASYSGYLGYFTFFCYFFCLSAFILDEIFKKGSKIEIKPLTAQRHHSESIFADFAEAIKERIDVFFRSKIIAFTNCTKAHSLPSEMRVLYNHEANNLKDVIKIQSEAQNAKVIKLPMKIFKVASSATETEEKSQRQSIGFKTQQGTNNNGNTETLPTANNQRTFAVHSSNVENTTEKSNEKTRNCLHCGEAYIYSIHNQKYCSESHRIAAYELRSGKELRAKKK